jgi:hypothetical protein
MNRSPPHRLNHPVPDEMALWHLLVWIVALLLAIAMFAWWNLPAF